jgi:hypothetical protein
MSCINKLTANLSYSCDASHKPIGGLDGSKAVLINRSDLDYTALTQSGATITNITLKSGATGFNVEYIKQLASTTSKIQVNENGIDKFQHSFACRIFGSEASDAERMKELSSGEFIVVVETKYKGTDNKSAYKVYGWDNGLRISESNYSSLENDGSMLFALSSVKNFEESYPYNIYLETDYSTTKAKVDGLFA